MRDLKLGMKISGRVENVTTFGAFCDIGIEVSAYIPRHCYPFNKSSQATTSYLNQQISFVLRLGDRINAQISHLDFKLGRVSLKNVTISQSITD